MAPGTRANPNRGRTVDTRRDEEDAVSTTEQAGLPATVAEDNAVSDKSLTNSDDFDTAVPDEKGSSEADMSMSLKRIEDILSTLVNAVSRILEVQTPRAPTVAGLGHGAGVCDSNEEESRVSTTCVGCVGDHSRGACKYHCAKQRKVQYDGDHDAVAGTDYDIYPTHVAYKIYQKGMLSARCRRIGDGSFFIAKRSWDRLAKDFPTTKAGEKRLLPLAFDGDARFVYEEIAGNNPNATCNELWEILGKRLCNDIHQSSLRDRFFAMKWNEKKETFGRFAWRLRSASLLLPETVDDGLLLNRLKNGLPNRLQDQAKLVSGTFDEVVSRVSSLSTAQQVSRHETVREVREPNQSPTSGRTEKGPAEAPSAADRFAHVRCHYCQQLGHISRDCGKKKSDRLAAGKEKGYQQSPAGSSPKRN